MTQFVKPAWMISSSATPTSFLFSFYCFPILNSAYKLWGFPQVFDAIFHTFCALYPKTNDFFQYRNHRSPFFSFFFLSVKLKENWCVSEGKCNGKCCENIESKCKVPETWIDFTKRYQWTNVNSDEQVLKLCNDEDKTFKNKHDLGKFGENKRESD